MKTIQHKTFRDCEIVVSDAPRKINSYGIVLDLTEAEADKLAKVAGFCVMADPSDVMESPAEVEVDSTEDVDADEETDEDEDETEAETEAETVDVAADKRHIARVSSGAQKKRGRPAGKRGK